MRNFSTTKRQKTKKKGKSKTKQLKWTHIIDFIIQFIQSEWPNFGDVDTKRSVNTTTLNANQNAKIDWDPIRIFVVLLGENGMLKRCEFATTKWISISGYLLLNSPHKKDFLGQLVESNAILLLELFRPRKHLPSLWQKWQNSRVLRWHFGFCPSIGPFLKFVFFFWLWDNTIAKRHNSNAIKTFFWLRLQIITFMNCNKFKTIFLGGIF